MAEIKEYIQDYFEANLKAVEYNKEHIEFLHVWRPYIEFSLKFLHDVVMSGRFKGSKVLDVGSGATVHNIASFSSKFSNIVQCDYVLDNCNELKQWHAGKSILDWTEFLEIVLKLEGKEGNTENLKELESRIRKNVKAVVRADVLSDNIIIEEGLTPETSPPYDVIVSILCLQTAAPDFDEYVAILKRLNKLLRKGGGLVICDFENGSRWKVSDNVFHYIKLNLDQIKDAMTKAGFGNCEIKTLPKRPSEHYYQFDNLFCLAAEKL